MYKKTIIDSYCGYRIWIYKNKSNDVVFSLIVIKNKKIFKSLLYHTAIKLFIHQIRWQLSE